MLHVYTVHYVCIMHTIHYTKPVYVYMCIQLEPLLNGFADNNAKYVYRVYIRTLYILCTLHSIRTTLLVFLYTPIHTLAHSLTHSYTHTHIHILIYRMREETLKSLVWLVDRLDERSLQDRLVRCVTTLQADTEPSIRTNAVM